jgi:hypothetical protein
VDLGLAKVDEAGDGFATRLEKADNKRIDVGDAMEPAFDFHREFYLIGKVAGGSPAFQRPE